MTTPSFDAEKTAVIPAGWKTQFLADVSHEVRTPLSGITGMTDLLLETPLNAEQRDYVLTARACAEELLAILDNALYLADLTLDPPAIARQDFPLRETLQAALSISRQAAASEVQFSAHLAHDLPEVVNGDAVRTGKLLSEMALCAIRACGQGQVSIAVSGERGRGRFLLALECRVTPGPRSGPAAGDASSEPRHPAAGKARNNDGLRLGWSLVHELTRFLGGALSFSSKAEEGCRCRSVIPFDLPGEEAPARTFTGAGENLKTILLVEDNEIARRVVLHILSRNRPEYAVDCAAGAPDALEQAGRRRYDLILMDLQLPGPDGFEIARRLRELAGYAEVPVVALTANVTPEYREHCLRRGMADFIAKPVQAAELLAAVDKALQR